jgi:hemolysin activation/secretion protein
MAIIALLACLDPLHAQVLPRTEQDPAQRLIQERRARELQREFEQPALPISVPESAPAALPLHADIETLPDVEPIFLIDRIDVIGDPMLPAAEVRRILQAGIGKRLGANRINLLLQRFAQAFVTHGLLTTRAYLGVQNLGSGVLAITIVPGKIEAITLNGRTLRSPLDSPSAQGDAAFDTVGGGWLTDLGTLWALPASAGDVLRLSDLEQSADQINRLRRNQAEMQILPGTTPGGSIVAIANRPGDRFHFSAGFDNFGSPGAGVARTRLGLDADNLLGFQEGVSVNYSGSLDSNALVVSIAAPIGYHLFSYTAAASEFQSAVGDTALLVGRTVGHTLGWNTVQSRSQDGRTSTDVTLTRRGSERDINNIMLGPQRLSVLRMGITRQQRIAIRRQQAGWTLGAGISKGLKALNASMDSPDIQDGEAHSQFTKVDVSADIALPLGTSGTSEVNDTSWANDPSGNVAWSWRGQFNGQWSRVALFGSEQLFAGGMASVRGFRDGVISGDRGFTLRNELVMGNAPAWFGVYVEPYAFLDGGRTQLIAEGRYRQLVGGGFGLRLQARYGKQIVTSEILVGRALQQPDQFGPKKTIALATLNWIY